MDEELRDAVSIWLWFASAAIIVAGAVWGWLTSDFWETIPLLSTTVPAAIVAGLAGRIRERRGR
jgi:hypothetical protein